MAKEPLLVFRLSHPEAFQCSACDEYCGAFDTGGWAIDVIDSFREHVRRYHPKSLPPSISLAQRRPEA